MVNEIKKRYQAESNSCEDLSCGNNLVFLEISQGETILDMGCGRGAETIEAAERAGAMGKAVGLDLTPAMVEIAQKNAEKAGALNTEFVVGDIENLPFDNDTFDAVMSNCVINHAKDKGKVYREIHRVLKHGGRFVVSDAVTKEPLPEQIKNDPEAWAQCFGGAVTEEEYLDSIRCSGFDEMIILKRREYIKNSFDFISLTIMAVKK